MRKDHKHIIVGKPRYNSRYGRTGDQLRKFTRLKLRIDDEGIEDYANVGTRISMGSKYRPDYNAEKNFTDHIAPLYRLIDSSVGRKWNDVYSKICEHADTRSLLGWHFRVHLHRIVDEVYTAPNGEKVVEGRYGYSYADYHHDLDTGLLQKKPVNREWKKRAAKARAGKEVLKPVERDGRYFLKRNGAWYEVFGIKAECYADYLRAARQRYPRSDDAFGNKVFDTSAPVYAMRSKDENEIARLFAEHDKLIRNGSGMVRITTFVNSPIRRKLESLYGDTWLILRKRSLSRRERIRLKLDPSDFPNL